MHGSCGLRRSFQGPVARAAVVLFHWFFFSAVAMARVPGAAPVLAPAASARTVVATLPTAGFAAGDRVDAGARAAGADESWLRDMHARIDRPRHDASAPPATVPLLTSPSWTAESDQAQALFGYSVLTAGDVNGDGFSDVIVGSPGYGSGAGRAWVFLGSSTGLSPTALWTADGDQAGAGFGTSVGTAGDVNGDGYADVVIGAPGYSFDQTGEGRAFVYLGSSGGLSLSPAWMADGEQELAAFGCSVGTAGDVNGDGYADIIVGAGRFDSGEVDTGRAYVYGGSADGLSAGPVWTGEGDQIGSLFGSSVGTAGDVNADGYADIIVGSPGHDYTQADEGRACVYRGSPGGLSTYAYWTADGNQQGARFGGSVATAGDVNGDGFSDVLVGADGYDNGEADEGRAFLYEGSFSGLATSPAWTAEGNQVSAGFGVSVATAGDVNGDGYADVIVGASSYDNGQTDEGRAFVYLGSRSGLAASAIATVESNQASAHFGSSVGTAGDVNGDGLSDFIVGAKNFDGGQINGGRAYVYHGVAGVLAATPSWTAIGDQAYATFGTSVATAGDVNGDGYSDVIVGAPMYDNEYYTEGRAYVYLGSSGGLSTEPSWIVEGDEPGAYLGTCVATAGDVNGDGFSDVIVSAYRASHGQDQEGLVYAYLGSPSGLSTTPAWMGESDQAGAWYGFSAATAGDVNGDGYSDVIVGAAIYDTTQPDAGRVYVYFGSANGLSATADWTKDCQQAYAKFGVFVGTAGDVNGDGYSDIIVGAYQYDNGSTDEGRAFVYLGSADGVSADPVWTAESNQADAWFGYPVRTAGDVNGDGYSDIIVGAQWYTNDHLREGRAYAYYGSPTGLSANPSWMAEGNQALAAFGVSVATAGDVNNDGYSDVIIGAQHYDNPESDEGRAYVYLGSPTGLAASPAWTTESNQADALLGYSANTAGDVNGDGFSDVIVGTYYYDNGSQTDVGRADVYCGNAGGGLHRLPGQTRADGSTPIWPMGMSDALGEFSLRAVGRTPLGRGAVRLQYEMKPFGTPFDGSGLVTGSALDSGSPRRDGSLVRLLQPVTGLALNTLFHWRLRTVSNSPLFPQSPWFTLPYNSVTEADIRTIRVISDAPEGPDPGSGLLMVRSSPNPFGASTSLDYAVPERGRVMLGIYDAAGREVVILVDRDEEPGLRTVQWDGVDSRGVRAPAGVYFGRLRAGGRERASKIVLSR